ncbi:MAG: phosphohistidine phosphatase SixA [Candidatus Eremiobacteraeota bacterium]|nr:phosphohistidine phosphatase SixA [Candidatus Eremiobacteraeota bacterium]
MRLYFLRHGQAGERDDWHGDDFDRPLTTDGIKRMEREADTMAELDLELDAIVTSPLVRARQTAEIVAKRLKLRKTLVEDGDLGLEFDVSRLQRIVEKFPKANAIMLVGHDPTMSRTIGQLIGGARIDFKKGALACVDLTNDSAPAGELVWLIPPRVLSH